MPKVTKIPRKRDQRRRRVAAYCRVSTMLENQEESYEAQVSYYSAFIEANEEWEFAGIYSDEKSGVKAENRPGFQQMIKDALAGQVDYILVKSVSRFSRNVVDCQKYANLLQTNGVYVRFEKEGIDTSEPSSSMMFSFLSVIAQNESKSISDNVKWGYRERYKRGDYNLGSNRVLGYDCVDGRLVPNKDAETVRFIFGLAVEGKSCWEISKRLREDGILGKQGKPLTPEGVKYILSNETYVGDRILQKQAPKNLLTKRPEKNVEYDSYYLKDDHEAVIDRKTWETVKEKMETRRKEIDAGVKYHGSRSHFLYGKVFCEKCGAPMTRRTLRCSSKRENKETYKAWTCKERHLGRKGNGCRNRNAREDELLLEIGKAMGYDGVSCAELFPSERFLDEVEAVYVGEEIRVVRKGEIPTAEREKGIAGL